MKVIMRPDQHLSLPSCTLGYILYMLHHVSWTLGYFLYTYMLHHVSCYPGTSQGTTVLLDDKNHTNFELAPYKSPERFGCQTHMLLRTQHFCVGG